jgi:hypothetical protein
LLPFSVSHQIVFACPEVAFWDQDRRMSPDIDAVHAMLARGDLWKAAKEQLDAAGKGNAAGGSSSSSSSMVSLRWVKARL